MMSSTTINTSMIIIPFLRPMIILLCGMLLFNLPLVIYKIRLGIKTILYLCFCFDKSYSKPNIDPSTYFPPEYSTSSTTSTLQQQQQQLPPNIRKKTIYFVRHGESTWNDTFNKGKHRSTTKFVLYFIPNLVYAILYEIYLLLSGKMDSWFYDAPLSKLGIEQINDLSIFLYQNNDNKNNNNKNKDVGTMNQQEIELQRHLSILRRDIYAPKSKLVASNLRRAISTIVGAFHPRLVVAGNGTTTAAAITTTTAGTTDADKILIVPALQEISSNPDTLCITPPHTTIQASWLEQSELLRSFNSSSSSSSSFSNDYYCTNYQQIYNTQIDMSLHSYGDKPFRTTNGLKRIMEFCQFIFTHPISEEYIIVGGHSLWFRSFFQLLLPYTVDHIAKRKKIVNGGIVVFDLYQIHPTTTTKEEPKYMIDPKSIQIIYGGF